MSGKRRADTSEESPPRKIQKLEKSFVPADSYASSIGGYGPNDEVAMSLSSPALPFSHSTAISSEEGSSSSMRDQELHFPRSTDAMNELDCLARVEAPLASSYSDDTIRIHGDLLQVWEKRSERGGMVIGGLSQARFSQMRALGGSQSSDRLPEMRNILLSQSTMSIIDIIDYSIHGKKSPAIIVRALLHLLPKVDAAVARGAICSRIVSQPIQSAMRREKSGVFAAVIPHLGSLEKKDLIFIGDRVLCGMKALEPDLAGLLLLPKVAATIDQGKGAKGAVSYTSKVLEEVCGLKWDAEMAPALVSLGRDMGLRGNSLDMLLTKVFEVIPSLEFPSVPALVYQLLLIGKKTTHRQIIEGISAAMGEIYAGVEGERDRMLYLHMEGTILLHFHFVVQQDTDLGKAILSLFGNQQPVTAFSLGLVLTIARVGRLAKDALKCLVRWVCQGILDRERFKTSPFLRRIADQCPARVEVESVVLDMIEDMQSGREVLLGIAYKLSFDLLTYPAAKKANVDSVRVFGKEMMLALCALSGSMRGHLLESMRHCAFANVAHSIHLNAVFHDAIDHFPEAELREEPLTSFVIDVMESLSLLSDEVATEMVSCIAKVLRDGPLTDRVMLILRKSSFGNGVQGRLLACKGFMAMLDHLGSEKDGRSQRLCRDIIHILGRARTQQVEIRAALYVGLVSLYEKHILIRAPIAETLLDALSVYLHTEIPLDLRRCIQVAKDDAELMEPLAVLLWALQSCQHIASHAEIEQVLGEILGQVLEKNQIKHWDFSVESPISHVGSEGRTNLLRLEMLMGILHVFISHVSMVGEGLSEEALEAIFSLHKFALDVEEYRALGLHVDAGVDGPLPKKGGVWDRPTLFSPECSCRLLHPHSLERLMMVFAAGKEEGEAVLAISQRMQTNLSFGLTLAKHSLAQMEGYWVDSPVEWWSSIAGSAVISFLRVEGAASIRVEGKVAERNEVFIKIFSLCIGHLCDQHPFSTVLAFLSDAIPIDGVHEEMNAVERMCMYLRRMMRVMEHLLDQSRVKEVYILFTVIIQLVDVTCKSHEIGGENVFPKVWDWIGQFIMHEYDHIPLTKAALRLYCKLAVLRGGVGGLTRICTSVLTQQGSIKPGEVAKGDAVRILEGKGLEIVLNEVSEVVMEVLEDVEWVCKRSQSWSKQITEDTSGFLHIYEDVFGEAVGVGRQLGTLLAAMIPTKLGEMMLKQVIMVYSVGTQIAQSLQHMGIPPGEGFTNLVAFFGGELSGKVYVFLSYLQAQSEGMTIRKEQSVVPKVVYALEKFEETVIRLGEKQHLDLHGKFRRNAARDFRIRAAEVESTLEGMEDPKKGET